MKKIFLAAIVLAAASLLVSVALAGTPGSVEPKDSADIQSKNVEKSIAKADPNAEVKVIVTLKNKATDGNIANLQGKAGPFKIYSKGWTSAYPNGFAASMTKKQLEALLQDPAVARVDIDEEKKILLETANYWSGATKARAVPPTGYDVTGDRNGFPYNYNKDDVVIAIVDTGIDPMHRDLNGTDNGGTRKIIGWFDAVYGYTQPYDDNGHGTHVASIAAGEGDDSNRYKGVAPGAALVGIKVCTYYGSCYDSDIIEGVNWAVENKNTYGIKVMSLSLGGYGSSDGTDPMSVAVNNAVNSGIVVTIAAGNSGPQKYTISSPGAAANVITVGAIADAGYALHALPEVTRNELAPPVSPDKIKAAPSVSMYPSDNGFYLAPFSSRGPTADNRIKPDIVAPGVMVMAAASTYPNTADFHGNYIEYSGTSMATPFTAGVVALMLDANYLLSPLEVKNYLRNSAENYGVSGCDIDYGCGRIRAYKAVGMAASGGTTPPGDQWVPTHLRYSSSINGTTFQKPYTVQITADDYPFASTLIMTDWSGTWPGVDLDLYIYDPSSSLIASSYGIYRQETLVIGPEVLGRYNATIYKYAGAGRYTLDISKRI